MATFIDMLKREPAMMATWALSLVSNKALSVLLDGSSPTEPISPETHYMKQIFETLDENVQSEVMISVMVGELQVLTEETAADHRVRLHP